MTTISLAHIMLHFLSLGQFDQLIICNPMLDDNYVSELFNISATYDIYITNWNCSGTEVMEVNKALIVLLNPTQNDVNYLLNQEGAQMSLSNIKYLADHYTRYQKYNCWLFQKQQIEDWLKCKTFLCTRKRQIPLSSTWSWNHNSWN